MRAAEDDKRGIDVSVPKAIGRVELRHRHKLLGEYDLTLRIELPSFDQAGQRGEVRLVAAPLKGDRHFATVMKPPQHKPREYTIRMLRQGKTFKASVDGKFVNIPKEFNSEELALSLYARDMHFWIREFGPTASSQSKRQ